MKKKSSTAKKIILIIIGIIMVLSILTKGLAPLTDWSTPYRAGASVGGILFMSAGAYLIYLGAKS